VDCTYNDAGTLHSESGSLVGFGWVFVAGCSQPHQPRVRQLDNLNKVGISHPNSDKRLLSMQGLEVCDSDALSTREKLIHERPTVSFLLS
jgi:hypothetical protein